MTAEERLAQLEMELAKERAKTARVEAELAAERTTRCLGTWVVTPVFPYN